MRAPTSAQHQKNTDLLGWRAEQRFEVRRAAGRRRGATLAFTRKPKDAKSGRSASTLTPYPLLAIVAVVASLVVLFALAVMGAYGLLRAVLGS